MSTCGPTPCQVGFADDADDDDNDGQKYRGDFTPLILKQEGPITHQRLACAGDSLIGRRCKLKNVKKENIYDSPLRRLVYIVSKC